VLGATGDRVENAFTRRVELRPIWTFGRNCALTIS
jgi:hypothetical protein